MLDVRRLPSAVIATTFALSGLVATTGATSVALGAGRADAPICSGIDEHRPAGGILDCLGPSTAYVQSPIGSGSGLVLPGGYLLTNAHVVDPFDKVDVTLGTSGHEEEHKDVPVKGVDLFADIAVLGPIKTDAPAVHLVDPSSLEEGDELFLVGYPGEANKDDLQPTIADGILSRTRHSKVFGLHYLQTDASIGGGQSGGALVDITGAVVGISSLRFAENFALALSGADAQAAVDKILAGDGSDYETWPGGDPVTSTTLHLLADYEPEILSLPVSAQDSTVDVTVPADLPIIIVSTALEEEDYLEGAGNLVAVAAEELDVPQSQLANVPESELEKLVAEDATNAQRLGPGVFRFKVPANEHVVLTVMTNRPEGLDTSVSTSTPMVPIVAKAPVALQLGQVIDGTVGSLVPYDSYKIDLAKGQEIHIYAGSPSGDMDVLIEPPSGPEKEFDDSQVGLYGVDVDETYTAPAAGTYEIQVGQVSEHATGYHLEVNAPS